MARPKTDTKDLKNRGRLGFMTGMPLDECPYSGIEGRSWKRGWIDARTELIRMQHSERK